MTRWYHSSGAWTTDTNAEIDTAQYDNGTDLTAVTANKYYKSLFFVVDNNIHWVYPREEFDTVAQAVVGDLPAMPPGVNSHPKSTALVLQGGAAAFPASGSSQWIDVRPIIGGASLTGVVSDHGELAGLTDDDHTQYLLADGTRGLSANWDAGAVEIRAETFESDVASGTAPFTIASTTVSTNLNADLLDGQEGSYYVDSDNFGGTEWTDLTDSGASTLHKNDHGGQDGLTDDDHSQYALLAGRSGGQALYGGTAASNNLTLRATNNATDGDIIFQTDSTPNEVMRIDGSAQRVGIGIAAPSYDFDVRGDRAANYLVFFFNDGDDNARHGMIMRCGADDGVGSTVYFGAQDGDGDLIGYLEQTAGSVFRLVDVSDSKFKQDIADSKVKGVDVVKALPVKEYRYKKAGPAGKLTKAGFVAQELEDIYPDAVSLYTDPEEPNEQVKGVAHSTLVPVLVKALQEQQVKIEELEQRIEALELEQGT
jgi:hypothetical protein